jgi:hypothetical protein
MVDRLGRIDRMGSMTAASAITFRSLRPGDMGFAVHRHGVLHAAEYGWDWTFEALVAKVAAKFIETFDTACRAPPAVSPDGDRRILAPRRSGVFRARDEAVERPVTVSPKPGKTPALAALGRGNGGEGRCTIQPHN